MNINKKDIYQQSLWDATKAVLRGKLIVLNAYITKEESSTIKNQSFQLKTLFLKGEK